MEDQEKLFYSILAKENYEGSSPEFYDDDFEWKLMLEENASTIVQEIKNFLTDDKLSSYYMKPMVSEKGKWKTIPFITWGMHYRTAQSGIPKTMELMRQVPGLLSFSINKLYANAEIKPHVGDTNAAVRCHIGVEVNGRLPELGIRVKKEERQWQNGKLIAFCDAHEHTAWNNTDSDRTIILFDVIKPMYLNKKRRVRTTVLSGLYLQGLVQKMNWIEKMPRVLQYCLFTIVFTSIYIWVPVRNLFSKLF